MKKRTPCLVLMGLLVLSFSAGAKTRPKQTRVVIETDKGAIEVEIDEQHAPITSANFLRYVDGHFYDGGSFHRTVRPDNQQSVPVPIAVVQADVGKEKEKQEFPAIPLERTTVTGLKHVDGAISMARDGPDTATASFFICIGKQPELDFGGRRNPDGQGFAAFGRVVRGMDVVRTIQMSRADGEALTPAIKILRVRRK